MFHVKQRVRAACGEESASPTRLVTPPLQNRGLYCSPIKPFKSFRSDLCHAALSALAIHKVFPAAAALPDTNLPRKSNKVFYGRSVLWETSIKLRKNVRFFGTMFLRMTVTESLARRFKSPCGTEDRSTQPAAGSWAPAARRTRRCSSRQSS